MPPPKGTPNPLEGPGDYTTTKTVHSDTYPAIDPTKLPKPLTGRTVFIVGASRGIGKAVALAFAKGGASQIAIGARPGQTSSDLLSAVADELKAGRDDDNDEQPPPLQVLCVPIEVSDGASVAAAAACIDEVWGGVDVVVQVAGVLGTPAKMADADPDEWWKVYEVNVKGQFLLAKYFLPLMMTTTTTTNNNNNHQLRARDGSDDGLKTFVTVSSVGAHLAGPGFSQYQPSKLVNLRLAEFIDAEYRELGVSAFCVHPGNVVTDMVGGTPDSKILETLGLEHVFVDTPELAADTIVYLTAEKRQWLSGRYINCIWDMPELLSQKEDIVAKDRFKVRLVL